jgi:murein DD-endopeptidase MepM/ murein hydrolase activator NlpD
MGMMRHAKSVGLALMPVLLATSGATPEVQPRAIRPGATVRWSPERVVEGTLFAVILEGIDPAATRATGQFAGEPLHFQAADSMRLVAMAAAPLDSTGGRELHIEWNGADSATDARVLTVPVERGAYQLERLSVAPEFGRPQPPDIQRRIAAEAARARAVSAASHGTPRLWQPPFSPPRTTRITSGFGHGRTFNGQIQSRHTGTDYAGQVGAPVLAPARGVVALADTFYLGGRVLYIDHGAGLVTGYLHLNALLVAQGDTVERGTLIGRVGASGRVTGPHLHWIVRYGGHTVDALSLLSLVFP